MTWLWDASTSLDVAAYIIYLCVAQGDGTCSPWVKQGEVHFVMQMYSDNLPAPPIGRAYVYNVEARDWAGNESTR